MKKKLCHFFPSILLFFCCSTSAQNVGIGTNTPKAALDVTSTTSGFLPPRITYIQRNAIQNPVAGLIVYCMDCGLNGEMQFYNGTTWMNLVIGTGNGPLVMDISGNTYPTVTIGTQVWMAENLRTTKYNDGSDIPVVADNTQWSNNYNNDNPLQQPMMCWFNNDQATYIANKFGAFYNWYAINPASNGNKNVCPMGWHIPSDAEWTILSGFLGGDFVAGGKMKSPGIQYWQSPNQDATNSSGFSGLPAGFRFFFNGSFGQLGSRANWWSSTGYETNTAVHRYLLYENGRIYWNFNHKTTGFSVRCLKD